MNMQSYDEDNGDDGNDNDDNAHVYIVDHKYEALTCVYVPLIITTLDNIVNLLDHVVDVSLFVQHYPPLLLYFPANWPISCQLTLKYFRQCSFIMENKKQDIYGL